MASRPTGVTILAWLATLQGLAGLIIPIALFGASAFVSGRAGGWGTLAAIIGTLVGVFKLIGPLLYLVFAFGAFTLKSWAWVLGVADSALSLLGPAWAILIRSDSWTQHWWSLGLPLIILIYLLQPHVRRAFGE